MLIKNCKIIKDKKEQLVDILIMNGIIKKIDKNINVEDNQIIDAHNNYVLPGIIDVHCHMRQPGSTQKEDLISGSKACCAGGVTTFLDMPNTKPPTMTRELLEEKQKIALNNCYTNYGFYIGSDGKNIEEIKKTKDIVAATKIFLNLSTGKLMIEDRTLLDDIFKASKLVAVHAEDESVSVVTQLSKQYNTPLYVCHVSSIQELNQVIEAKKQGIQVYAEVTPHHLLLNQDDLNKNETNKKLLLMKPVLKTKKDNEALWQAIKDGWIDTISTDHAPHLLEEKLAEDTYGIPGVEYSLELMLNAVHENKLSLEQLINLMSTNAANIFKLKNKGKLEVGYDADITIIDINDHSIIDGNNIVSKCNWTPYKGFKRGGRVLKTIVNGELVYDNNKFYENKGKEVKYE